MPRTITAVCFPKLFPRVQASLDTLPFASASLDLAIFNASFHYSEDFTRTLREAIRCVRTGGAVIIMDTPWYAQQQSGEQMIAEKQSQFQSRYGFASNSIPSLEFVTPARLRKLESALDIKVLTYRPVLRTAMVPAASACLAQAPPHPLSIPRVRGEGAGMIILYHPRATRPRNRRLPLAVLALAAALEGKEEYEIVDGNLEENPTERILELIDQHNIELLGVSCMPGPQMVAAMETSA